MILEVGNLKSYLLDITTFKDVGHNAYIKNWGQIIQWVGWRSVVNCVQGEGPLPIRRNCHNGIPMAIPFSIKLCLDFIVSYCVINSGYDITVLSTSH